MFVFVYRISGDKCDVLYEGEYRPGGVVSKVIRKTIQGQEINYPYVRVPWSISPIHGYWLRIPADPNAGADVKRKRKQKSNFTPHDFNAAKAARNKKRKAEDLIRREQARREKEQ